MLILTIALSLCIGLLLGLLGGGGSILTVPMLVYVLGVEAKAAIVTSFVVVGSSSLIALLPHARSKAVCWKSGFWFGSSGMLAAYFGGHLATGFSNETLMILFGIVSLLAGLAMLHRSPTNTNQDQYDAEYGLCPLKIPFVRLILTGSLVGFLTGMVGVGGGFLIVPALSMLVGLPIQGAIGTSLLIIFLNATSGLIAYSQHIDLDWHLVAIVALASLGGSLVGSLFNTRIQPARLKQGFSALVIAVACYVLYQNSQAAYQLIWPDYSMNKEVL